MAPEYQTVEQILTGPAFQGPNNAECVLETDKKTPDSHVARDERLVRLTGAHPFNSEAPLDLLYNAGFITPSSLHFVRNHGPVPESTNDVLDWEIEIDGMVERPLKIRLRELIEEVEQVTLPVTLVCAGNRRKEQNMVKKGTGFNWGAAGVSTSLWTGFLMRDVLKLARPLRGAKYLCMEGCDKLPNGAYGTCIILPWAMDFDRAVMLAWKQNGALLEPDHGRPLRALVPGVIGGRSVKWLKKLTITDSPSQNFYHIYDNRVLPTMVTPEMAKEDQKWWMDERYAIMNLNVQSVTTVPEHDSQLKIDGSPDQSFTIRGFAYNGGGIRIGHVEVSLDGGSTWRLASIDYPEDSFRETKVEELFGGKIDMYQRHLCFCWCFWDVKVPVSELASSSGILVRAMDINMTVQPRNMYWNVSSMLNNWWYRVAIRKEGNILRFEHPVLPALQKGGWMDRVKAQGGDILDNNYGEETNESAPKKRAAKKEGPSLVNPEVLNNIISHEELQKHENEQTPWIVVDGQVYDVTDYLESHPGGPESITMVAATDVTEDFMAIHSDTAKALLKNYHIGTLASTPAAVGTETTSEPPGPVFLEPKKWKTLKLTEREVISSDSRILTFKLEHPEQTSGLPVGKHLFLRAKDSNGYVMRAYTPVSSHKEIGVIRLLIKVYFPNKDQPGGKMTTLLEQLKVGDPLEFKGPTGSFEYPGNGAVLSRGMKSTVRRFYMISGGSGITPCYQVLKSIAEDSEDTTEAVLLFGNRYEGDILCKSELCRFEQMARGRIQIKFWLSGKMDQCNTQHTPGRIDLQIMDHELSHMKEGHDSMLLVCGPEGMVETAKEWQKSRNIEDFRVVYF